ncbi:hypothetical protein JCM10908_007189 [Rhodotorula pacifica]|uniref:uncharacterized protein n=1 Tax=Rhodotorula pacifica TaxID=1495444 RepID=UPI003177A6E3
MPTPVKLLDSSADSSYHVVLSWDFEANLSDLPEDGYDSPKFTSTQVPLQGEWQLSLHRDKSVANVCMRHGKLAFAALGQAITVSLGLDLLSADGGLPINVTQRTRVLQALPKWSTEGTVTYEAHALSLDVNKLPSVGQRAYKSTSRYRFTATLSKAMVNDPISIARTPFSDEAKALRMADLHLHPTSACVRFVFSNAAETLELWAAKDSLIKCSPYFDDMLKSACAETIPRRAKRARSQAPEAMSPIKAEAPREKDASDQSPDWQDSDDEVDDFVRSVRKPTTHDLATEGLDFEYRQITVTETAYSTYRAVLLYLLSGHIQFLQLRSSTAPRASSAEETRQEILEEHEKQHPALPLPVSPKSVYRLAHILQLPDLQKIALKSLASCLTVDGAAHELFCPASIAYDDLRKVVIKFVVKHWKAVRATDAWTEKQRQAACGEIGGSSLVLTELLAALSDAP